VEALLKRFVQFLSKKHNPYDETHVIFDWYDIDSSLKQATRSKRLGENTEITYHIQDNTPTGNIQMKQLLSANETKMN